MFEVATLCKAGGREYNQDYVGYDTVGKMLCIVVADGLGSYNGSDVASQTAVDFILNKFHTDAKNRINVLTPDYASSTIALAHKEVLAKKKANHEIESSCTTVVMVITNSERTVVSHIGDSRAYVIANGKITYQTRDHSMAQLAVDRGEIQFSQIRTHKDQNKLLRVLGSNHSYIGPDTVLHNQPLKKGDGIAVVTDGWWEYVYESQLEGMFRSDRSAEEILTDLEGVVTATAPPFCDNYSAVIAKKL